MPDAGPDPLPAASELAQPVPGFRHPVRHAPLADPFVVGPTTVVRAAPELAAAAATWKRRTEDATG